jgi:hypothetical protein
MLLADTLEILHRFDDHWARAMSLMFLGHVELADGHPEQARSNLVAAATLMRTIGNPLYLIHCLEGLAGVAAAREQWTHVARLCGARDALHSSLGLGVPPANPGAWTRIMERARAVLGDVAFATASDAGRSWSPDKAIDSVGALDGPDT